MKALPLVYIAGPYSAPTREGEDENIHRAAYVAIDYARNGWAFICPHTMTALIDREFNQDGQLQHQDWLDIDLEILHRCDAIHMLPGWSKSKGAQMEYEAAQKWGKQIRGATE